MHPSLHLKMKIFILADSSKMNQSMSECSLNFRTQLAGLHLDWTSAIVACFKNKEEQVQAAKVITITAAMIEILEHRVALEYYV